MKKKYIAENYFKIKNTEIIETRFLQLIKIGVLRREVDGQGLTSKVRVTPLGRLILENKPSLANEKPTLLELAKNWISNELLLV